MILLKTARKLKEAGLVWEPTLHDYFAIPDRYMDDVVFVISDIQVTVDVLQGLQVISFQGASEWALDSLVTSEAIWLPRESQLRQALEEALFDTGWPEVRLTSGLGGCLCNIFFGERILSFKAEDASEAYAAALLYVMRA